MPKHAPNSFLHWATRREKEKIMNWTIYHSVTALILDLIRKYIKYIYSLCKNTISVKHERVYNGRYAGPFQYKHTLLYYVPWEYYKPKAGSLIRDKKYSVLHIRNTVDSQLSGVIVGKVCTDNSETQINENINFTEQQTKNKSVITNYKCVQNYKRCRLRIM